MAGRLLRFEVDPEPGVTLRLHVVGHVPAVDGDDDLQITGTRLTGVDWREWGDKGARLVTQTGTVQTHVQKFTNFSGKRHLTESNFPFPLPILGVNLLLLKQNKNKTVDVVKRV